MEQYFHIIIFVHVWNNIFLNLSLYMHGTIFSQMYLCTCMEQYFHKFISVHVRNNIFINFSLYMTFVWNNIFINLSLYMY